MSQSYVSVPLYTDPSSAAFAKILKGTSNDKLGSALKDAVTQASAIRKNEAAMGLRGCEVYCEADTTGTIKCGIKCQFLM